MAAGNFHVRRLRIKRYKNNSVNTLYTRIAKRHKLILLTTRSRHSHAMFGILASVRIPVQAAVIFSKAISASSVLTMPIKVTFKSRIVSQPRPLFSFTLGQKKGLLCYKDSQKKRSGLRY